MTETSSDNSRDMAGIDLVGLLVTLADNLRLLVIFPLLVGVAALGLSYAITPTFTASAVILSPVQQQSAAALAVQSLGALVGGGAGSSRSLTDQYIALMQTASVENNLIDKFDLMSVYRAQLRMNARAALKSRTKISADKRDGLIRIEFDDTDPQRAAAIANEYIEQLRLLTTRLAVTDAQQRRAFFEKQLAQTETRFDAAQRALQAAGISEGALRAEPKAAAENYARLRAEVASAEVRLQALRTYLVPGAPELLQAEATYSALRAQLAKAEAVDNTAAGGEYLSRYREFKYYETLREFMLRQLESARLDESREGAVIQIVDPAVPPEHKSKPVRAKIAIVSTAVTFALLVAWLVLRHVLRAAFSGEDGMSRSNALTRALRRSLGLRVRDGLR